MREKGGYVDGGEKKERKKKKEREKNVVRGWWRKKKKKKRGTGTEGERERKKIEKIRYFGSCEKNKYIKK
jgi:hypothetical protein